MVTPGDDACKWLYQAMLNWANRHKNYKLISRYRIINSIIANGVILAAALLGYITYGLLVGFVAGGVTAMLVLYISIQKSNAPFAFNLGNAKLRETARKYDVFPKVNLWQAFADMLLINGVIYFLTFFFSQAVVGLYGMTMRVLQGDLSILLVTVLVRYFCRKRHINIMKVKTFSLL